MRACPVLLLLTLLALPRACIAGPAAPAPTAAATSAEVRTLLAEVATLRSGLEKAPPMSNYDFITGAYYNPRKFDFGLPIERVNRCKEVLVRYIDRNPRIGWQPGRTPAGIAELLVRECNPVFVELGLKDKPVVCDYLIAYAAHCYWSKGWDYDGERLQHSLKPGWLDAYPSDTLCGMRNPRGICIDLAVAVCWTVNACRKLARPDGKRYGGIARPQAVSKRDTRMPNQVERVGHTVVVFTLKDAQARTAIMPSNPGLYLNDWAGNSRLIASTARWQILPLTNQEMNAFGWRYNGMQRFTLSLGGYKLDTVWRARQAAKERPQDRRFGGGMIYFRDVWPAEGARASDVQAFYDYLDRTGPLLSSLRPD